MMSLPAMSQQNVSPKGGTGGGGWVHPKGANSMAVSGLIFTWRAISVTFGINGVRNKRSHLVGPPFPEFEARFSATAGWHFSRDLTRRLVIGVCGHSTYLLSMAEITSGSSFEANNLTEQKLGYICLRVTECENDLGKKTRTPKS